MLVHTNVAQNLCRFIFMQDIFVLFPDINVFLAHAEQNGNIFLRDDMPFTENRVLGHARDNLRDIMAEYLSDRLGGFNQLHLFFPRFLL